MRLSRGVRGFVLIDFGTGLYIHSNVQSLEVRTELVRSKGAVSTISPA